MQSIRIAYRNVLRQAKRTALLGGAIAFGFLVFTILNGFTGGLLDTVSGNLANALGGHIYISGSEVSSLGSEISVIRDASTIETAMSVIEEQVSSYNTRSSAKVSIIFASKEETIQLDGVNFSKETDFMDSLSFAKGSAGSFLNNKVGILLPEEMLEDLGVEVGESVILKTTTISGQQNISDVIVAGSLVAQSFFSPGGSGQGYMHIETLNELLGMTANQYQTLNIYLNDLADIDIATATLYKELARITVVEPRQEARSGPPGHAEFGFGGINSVDEDERWEGTKFEVTNLDDIMEGINTLAGVINAIGRIIFMVIIIIIMVGIMNSYRMVMIERTTEIGTMRAMGVHKSGIRNIFIWEALFVAISGTIMGLILAFIVMAGISLMSFGTDTAFSLFLNQGHIKFNLSFLSTLANILLICAISVAAVYVPARAAAQLEPAEALRAN